MPPQVRSAHRLPAPTAPARAPRRPDFQVSQGQSRTTEEHRPQDLSPARPLIVVAGIHACGIHVVDATTTPYGENRG
ncbi:hypothetical protein ACRAWF_40605 [Streptomyces sp. L7]